MEKSLSRGIGYIVPVGYSKVVKVFTYDGFYVSIRTGKKSMPDRERKTISRRIHKNWDASSVQYWNIGKPIAKSECDRKVFAVHINYLCLFATQRSIFY